MTQGGGQYVPMETPPHGSSASISCMPDGHQWRVASAIYKLGKNSGSQLLTMPIRKRRSVLSTE